MDSMTPRHLEDQGNILIAGTGRAGTTLLVQYFTALGFETGYSFDEAMSKVDRISKSGLEHSLGRTVDQGKALPYVAKSPWIGPRMGELIGEGSLRVQACIVPMRDLADAAESRRRVSRLAEESGADPTSHPGGVIHGKSRPNRSQEQKLALSVPPVDDLAGSLPDSDLSPEFSAIRYRRAESFRWSPTAAGSAWRQRAGIPGGPGASGECGADSPE